jgi:hypothetical protein
MADRKHLKDQQPDDVPSAGAAQGADSDVDQHQKPRRGGRRPTIADVFGDVLPETTRDEREVDESTRRGDDRDPRDDEFLRDVPPHHQG